MNCFELCFEDFVKNYALKHQISEEEARLREEVYNYDTEKNYKQVCSLECETTQFRILESKLNIDFSLNLLQIYVTFDSLKYTKITQTPKTTLSGLVSNIGGSSGVFLELSFLSVFRAIELELFEFFLELFFNQTCFNLFFMFCFL